jgi:hypothetical protein
MHKKRSSHFSAAMMNRVLTMHRDIDALAALSRYPVKNDRSLDTGIQPILSFAPMLLLFGKRCNLTGDIPPCAYNNLPRTIAMKIFIICTSMSLVLATVANAQDIEAKLSGNTTTEGFTVKSDAGTPLFTVRGDGKIGLGILNPDALLHVAGQVKITGGTPGAGKVLTSDANGLATWATPASGGGSLDQAYDFGGAGAGRTIIADSGAVVVDGVDGFLVMHTGAVNQGTIPASGAGKRMMWFPRRQAFRSGMVTGTQWDEVNIGLTSTAMGWNTTASGMYSTAMGYNTTASGGEATAMGKNTIAVGGTSTAMGFNSTASGQYSIAMGNSATSSGTASVAMGQNTSAGGAASTAMGNASTAAGTNSSAMGNSATASGANSTAIGNNTTASGFNSTALGCYASTGGYTGSMAMGDNSSTAPVTNTAANQLIARFSGGIGFYTNMAGTTGAYMNASASGWTNYSDRNKKENFTTLDGEAILSRLRAVPVSEWNYKGTDASVRYIGPMAQDFWQAFHLGGTDSLGINSISIDGVNMAAIQALEKRTTELRQKTDEIAFLKEEVADLKSTLAVYESQAAEIRQLKNDLTILKALLTGTSPAESVKHASLEAGK